MFENLETSNARLKALREYLGLSQAEFGSLWGKRQNTYRHWEQDDSNIPQPVRDKLHDLGVRLSWLDAGEGSDPFEPGSTIEVLRSPEGKISLRRVEGILHVSELHSSYLEKNPMALKAVQGVQAPEVPHIDPSMVAQAAQMVDALLESMQQEERPSNPSKWEAIARTARLLALDRLEGKEGTARTFLLGLRQEWAEARTKHGA